MKRKIPSPFSNPSTPKEDAGYDQFEASALFCSRCRQAVPVRKRMLLVLPDGDKYEYLCAYCSNSLGTKMEYEERNIEILVKP